MRIVDLEPDDSRLATQVLPVLKELRPHLTGESFAAVYQEGYEQGLRYTAVYDDDESRCLGVAGWRVVATTNVLRKLYIDDMVTAKESRSTGVGRFLLDDLSQRARRAGCAIVDLDSGVQRHGAHRFYFREGMHIASHHFAREVD
jgi:GNAT superfamily N-acetyltransferase